MSDRQHHYTLSVAWTGNKGTGTSGYREYERNHTISIPGKPDLACSSDTAFHGDPSKYNPEDMLIASLSACHMLWYLHLCADAGIIVTAYSDQPTGIMVQTNKGGHFTEVVLHPKITITDPSMIEKAKDLHHDAHEHCFIANSVNFPVRQQPEIIAG